MNILTEPNLTFVSIKHLTFKHYIFYGKNKFYLSMLFNIFSILNICANLNLYSYIKINFRCIFKI